MSRRFRHARLQRLAATAAACLAVGAASCTYDAAEPPPATRADVFAACEAFHEAACTTWGTCGAWDDARIAQCIADSSAFCQTERRTCWDLQVAAFDACSDDWSAMTCSDARALEEPRAASCAYACPPPTPY